MPVGIPKVAFAVPQDDDDDDDGSWVDIYNRVYRERLLFLGQEINSEVANQLVGLMVYLSLEDKTQDIYLFINSPGGGVISGMAVFDAMHFVEADVQTIGMGISASMASVILLGGAITKRTAFPHARVMMHQPASSLLESKTEECMLDSDEILKLRENVIQVYVQRTGKPSWQISRDMNRDSFMSAEEARAYGIVDIVSATF
uniref:ATP-dependent Clp protease proteolytic subunit n=1 Tax=Astragalus mollissimus var. mollissimus TaxID=2506115 RepID=A0A8K1N215_9FABA|nr:clp protease proteolytic subunit [Astragalus mollissimus var. mollissimus]